MFLLDWVTLDQLYRRKACYNPIANGEQFAKYSQQARWHEPVRALCTTIYTHLISTKVPWTLSKFNG